MQLHVGLQPIKNEVLNITSVKSFKSIFVTDMRKLSYNTGPVDKKFKDLVSI